MKPFVHREIRFYSCLLMAYSMMIISLFLPPLNVITSSVLYASIIILSVGGLAVGIDLKGVLREIRLMKNHDYISDEKDEDFDETKDEK